MKKKQGKSILDWNPDDPKSDAYFRNRAAMGDKRCQKILRERKQKKGTK